MATGGRTHRGHRQRWRQPLLDATLALLLGLGTFAAYRWAGGPVANQPSDQPHFVLLADALLNGRLWIDPLRAERLIDVTPFAGRVYVGFPPLPALLMLPFVAFSGPRFNDALFTVALGALNVALAYLLLRRAAAPGFAGPGLPVGRAQALAVAVLLGAGTVHLYASLMGRVWFTAHVAAVTFVLLYLRECAGRGRPLLAGAALAAAFLARTPVVFGAVFWLLLEARRAGAWRRPLPPDALRPDALRRTALFVLPVGLAVALLLAQNAVRFGSPLDFGYRQMRIARQLAPDLQRYGQFNLHFLSRNLRALLVTPPQVSPRVLPRWLALGRDPAALAAQLGTAERRRGFPFPVTFDPWGTGLWAVSPALVAALRPPRRRDAALFGAAWLAALAVAVPDLLYYNTGWYQYGYRFSLDFTPFLLLPAAAGLAAPRPAGSPALRLLYALWWTVWLLLLFVSVASNLLGARWFLRLPPY